MTLLTFPETRVLGCLIEKELTTPDYYPLTLNSLVTACNQTTNREPVTAFDEQTVQLAADSLREKRMATAVFGSGSRVQKYRHDFLDHYELNRKEMALLGTLLLRGAQTPGELRQRAERMAGGFGHLQEVETLLDGIAKGNSPLLRVIPAGAGRKEKRYVHLLAGEPSAESLSQVIPSAAGIYAPFEGGEFRPSAASGGSADAVELASVKQEIVQLREELTQLQADFAAFRKQFE